MQLELLKREWYRRGFYRSQSLSDAFADAARKAPETQLIFWSAKSETRIDLKQLFNRSRVFAAALKTVCEIEAGDVVAIQVPNWIEGAIAYQAIAALGAVMLPVIHIYDVAELNYILATSKARVLIVPDRWRNIDYVDRLSRLASHETLQHTIVIGESATSGYHRWRDIEHSADEPIPHISIDPDAVSVLLYTSGTTANPKCVQHTHNTILSECRIWETIPSMPKGPSLSPWPSGHMGGLLSLLQAFLFGENTVLMDAWDPSEAARLIETYRPVSMWGTPYHLSSLLDAAEAEQRDLSSFQGFLTGAASVPPSLVERAEHSGLRTYRAYGSTEHPTVSTGILSDPLNKRIQTDGRAISGTRIRVVDPDGCDVAIGQAGEIVTQGPEQFIGYLDETQNETAFLNGHWFRTGDIGSIDQEGYLTISDRLKDVIIRGGENISSKEVEDALVAHQDIVEVAVVAMPDERLGEIVCAFILLAQGKSITLESLRAYFVSLGLAKQKTPEHLVVVDSLPRTPLGKVKKNELRRQLVALAADQSGLLKPD